MINPTCPTTIERERIIKLVTRKFGETIEQRKELKRRKSHLTSCFTKLKENIIFLIENPDYVRLNNREVKT